MASIGLNTIQQAIHQIQHDLSQLSTTRESDAILGIRQRHVQSKITALGNQFKAIAGELTNVVSIIVAAMEFIEATSHKYAVLLDVSNTGSFKQELVLQLVKQINEEIDLDDAIIIIETLIRATNSRLDINIHKRKIIHEITESDPNQTIVVKSNESNNVRRLRKFLLNRH